MSAKYYEYRSYLDYQISRPARRAAVLCFQIAALLFATVFLASLRHGL